MITESDIVANCSQFLHEIGSFAVYKIISNTDDLIKIKLRHRRPFKDSLTRTFNEAVQQNQFVERSIATYTKIELLKTILQPGESIYSIYPVDGYEFTYMPYSSRIQLYQSQQELTALLGSEQAMDVIGKTISMNYRSDSIQEACCISDEIFFHNISRCYGVKVV